MLYYNVLIYKSLVKNNKYKIPVNIFIVMKYLRKIHCNNKKKI